MPSVRSASQTSRRRFAPSGVSSSTREAILKAAEEEFAAYGFGGARADSIARRAGVNKALPFYHFGSKADLYAAVLQRILDQLISTLMERPVVDTLDLETRLRVYTHSFFSYLRENPNWLKIVVRELIDEGSRARAIARRYLRPIVAAARVEFSRAILSGTLRALDPLQIMLSISSEVAFYALITPFLEGLGMHDPLGDLHSREREEAVVAILLNGLKAPQTGTN